jgi:hypothetical protein
MIRVKWIQWDPRYRFGPKTVLCSKTDSIGKVYYEETYPVELYFRVRGGAS